MNSSTATASTANKPKSMPLRRWLWVSYLSAALAPLLMIELSFLGIYWGTAQFVHDRSTAAVIDLSQNILEDAAVREAKSISEQLGTVEALTKVYADATGNALATPSSLTPEEIGAYAYSPDGVYYTRKDNGGSAVYYSGIIPITGIEREKAWRTAALDPLMKSIQQSDPLITQVYLNTKDSLNRIYPYFDVLDVYPPKMDIPSYNFYYEADPQHNPEGKVVWTDAYVDPAGSGWMISAIAPVMDQDQLEAVVGIDITIDTVIDQVLNVELTGGGYAMLVDRTGTILALPPAGEDDLGLTELTDHKYDEAVLNNVLKPSEFNIFRRNDMTDLALAMVDAPSGRGKLDLAEPSYASWATIEGTDWKLISVVHESALLTTATSLRDMLTDISKWMLAALLLFYLIFFAVLWKRASSLSATVAEPLTALEADMTLISSGGSLTRIRPQAIEELKSLNKHLVTMSTKLQSASKTKSAFLSAMSHELRTPLNAIMGHAQLLEMSAGKPLDSERIKEVQQIIRSGTELLLLIEAVMDISRLERGEVQASARAIDVMPLIRNAYIPLQPLAEDHGITMEIAAASGVDTRIEADPGIVTRVLSHIIANAVKYNKENGSIRIALNERDGALEVAVSDTGEGIPAADLSRLTEPFDRLGKGGGTIVGAGVGMSITNRLIQIARASLKIESTVGEGSTFTVTFPRSANE